MKGRILTLDSAEKPWCLENPKFSGDQITLPTSQKRVYGLFKASFFDCTIKFFAAFEKVRVFQQNQHWTLLLPDVTMGGGSACPIGNTERLVSRDQPRASAKGDFSRPALLRRISVCRPLLYSFEPGSGWNTQGCWNR